MFFRLKVAQLFGLILLVMTITAHPLYSAWWDRNTIPLPSGTEEVFQETRNISGTEFVLKYYTNSQDAKVISDFFRSKLTALDWKEKELLKEMAQIPGLKVPASVEDMLASNSIFEKGEETVMINFLPRGAVQDGKTRFTVARGNTEAQKKPEEDDFIPRLSGKPKLDIAPVYPGAALISLSENTGFMRATYFSKDDIDKVGEFYKSKMLNYGWSLAEEKPLQKLDSGEVDLSSLCPDCPKDKNIQQAIKPVDMEVQELNFSNEAGDVCIVALGVTGPKEGVGDKLKNTTTIMVQYEKAGK
ncbi:MAG: hypothetical protein PHP10_00900 [Candidatus Omnitrophica bacterium]|nr:hypothetical protein [Candidatus Omnitrophota bacterium]